MSSVVTKDVAPYAVVAGSPAKLLKYCFNQGIIDELLKSRWREFSDEKLYEFAK